MPIAAAPSAGGAPVDQIMVVAGFTAIVYAALLWVMFRERTGHATLVGRAADLVARVDGGPRWFALPALVSILGALSGAVGLYWDVSYHITEGRDEGPLANPSHYLIFLGLVAIFAGGALGMALANDRLPRRTLRLTRRWEVPFGPTVVAGIAMCALVGFPLDDVWHRLFGQDVTEWGPTHVLMIGGTIMLPYGVLLSVAEARQVGRSLAAPFIEWISVLVLAVGPVAFLLEYAFGVPQFPLVMDPIIITVAAVAAFGSAMYRGWTWVATVWVAYLGLEIGLMLLNTEVFAAESPKYPLLLGGALVALALAPKARPTLLHGAVSGLLITLGTLAVDFFWTDATRPMEWPAAMMPWAVVFGSLAGVGTGVLVAWMTQQLATVAENDATPAGSTLEAAPHAPAIRPAAALLAVVALVAAFAWNVPPRADVEGTADVTVGELDADGRAYLDVRVDPALVEDAYWFEALSWQGGGLVRGDLVEVEPGLWRTDVPMPLTGSWKTLVRLHTPVHDLVSAPVYLPADPAIPAPEFAVADGPRDFVEEKLILRREEKPDVPTWLWTTSYTVVGGLFALLVGVVGVGYSLAGRRGTGATSTSREKVGAR